MEGAFVTTCFMVLSYLLLILLFLCCNEISLALLALCRTIEKSSALSFTSAPTTASTVTFDRTCFDCGAKKMPAGRDRSDCQSIATTTSSKHGTKRSRSKAEEGDDDNDDAEEYQLGVESSADSDSSSSSHDDSNATAQLMLNMMMAPSVQLRSSTKIPDPKSMDVDSHAEVEDPMATLRKMTRTVTLCWRNSK